MEGQTGVRVPVRGKARVSGVHDGHCSYAA